MTDPILVRSKRPSTATPNPGQEQRRDLGRRRLLTALGLLVAILYFPALVLGPVATAVILFFLTGTWLGFFGSFTIMTGWMVVVADLLFVVLHYARKHIDRKLEETQTSVEV